MFGTFTDKKPTAGEIHIYTVNKCDNRLKVIKMTVMELWRQGYKLRINNINDKLKPANSEKDIKCQVFNLNFKVFKECDN